MCFTQAITSLNHSMTNHLKMGENKIDNEMDRVICNCGHSTRTSDRGPKRLCSFGCALECKFDTTLQAMYHACLKGKGDLHVPLQHDLMVVTLMHMKIDKDGVDEEIWPRFVARKF